MSTSMARRVVLVAGVFALLFPSSAFSQQYHRTDLTTDASAVSPSAPHVDPNLVNPWGLSRSSGSPWWVADNGPGLSTLYTGAGSAISLVVTIPTADGT